MGTFRSLTFCSRKSARATPMQSTTTSSSNSSHKSQVTHLSNFSKRLRRIITPSRLQKTHQTRHKKTLNRNPRTQRIRPVTHHRLTIPQPLLPHPLIIKHHLQALRILNHQEMLLSIHFVNINAPKVPRRHLRVLLQVFKGLLNLAAIDLQVNMLCHLYHASDAKT